MTRPIGYYVHHHGDGHRQRALALARAMDGRIVLLGTGLAGRVGDVAAIDLPDDRSDDAGFDGTDGAGGRPDALHYAPLDHDGIRRRTAIVTDWIARARPALIVVDVSVEIAMLARLAATPTVYVRLGGRRDDPAHLDAFRGAAALLAPFHADLDDPAVAAWVRRRTIHAAGLGAAPAPVTRASDDILVVLGTGGTRLTGAMLAAAARATPDRRWRVAGVLPPPRDCPPNLRLLGWVDAIDAEIGRAGIVVGGAGDGVMTAVLAAGRPFVCLPEARPFDEQLSKARRLAALGAAIVVEALPDAQDWRGVLDRAQALDRGAIARLHDRDGVERAAMFLRGIADGQPDRQREYATA